MKKFLNALGFLTIIKIPERYFYKKEEIAKSLIYFPAIGLIIGIIISLFYYALSFIFPLILSVILLLGLEVIVTGGAHLDGFCDMIDGIFSGRSDKDKILDIMKKSDIGVYGVLSIIFLVLLKISLIYYIATVCCELSRQFIFIVIIVFMPAFGRWSMVYLISKYKCARDGESLAKIFIGSKNNKKIFIISSIYLFMLFLAAYSLAGFLYNGSLYIASALNYLEVVYSVIFALLTVVVLFLLLWLIGSFFTRRIKGITGDVIGGVGEIIELLFLFISYLVLRFL